MLDAIVTDAEDVQLVQQQAEIGVAGVFNQEVFDAGVKEFDDGAAFDAEEVVVVGFGVVVLIDGLVVETEGAGDFMLAEDLQGLMNGIFG